MFSASEALTAKGGRATPRSFPALQLQGAASAHPWIFARITPSLFWDAFLIYPSCRSDHYRITLSNKMSLTLKENQARLVYRLRNSCSFTSDYLCQFGFDRSTYMRVAPALVSPVRLALLALISGSPAPCSPPHSRWSVNRYVRYLAPALHLVPMGVYLGANTLQWSPGNSECKSACT